MAAPLQAWLKDKEDDRAGGRDLRIRLDKQEK